MHQPLIGVARGAEAADLASATDQWAGLDFGLRAAMGHGLPCQDARSRPAAMEMQAGRKKYQARMEPVLSHRYQSRRMERLEFRCPLLIAINGRVGNESGSLLVIAECLWRSAHG